MSMMMVDRLKWGTSKRCNLISISTSRFEMAVKNRCSGGRRAGLISHVKSYILPRGRTRISHMRAASRSYEKNERKEDKVPAASRLPVSYQASFVEIVILIPER